MTLATALVEAMLSKRQPSQLWTSKTISFYDLERSINFRVLNKSGDTLFDHIMTVLDLIQSRNPITLWSALFHDLGKLDTVQWTAGKPRYPNHEIRSAVIAGGYLTDWGEDKTVIDRTQRICRLHMLDLKNPTDQVVRNFVANVGHDNIENWFVVRQADIASYNEGHDSSFEHKYLTPFMRRVMDYHDFLICPDSLDSLLEEDDGATGLQIN